MLRTDRGLSSHLQAFLRMLQRRPGGNMQLQRSCGAEPVNQQRYRAARWQIQVRQLSPGWIPPRDAIQYLHDMSEELLQHHRQQTSSMRPAAGPCWKGFAPDPVQNSHNAAQIQHEHCCSSYLQAATALCCIVRRRLLLQVVAAGVATTLAACTTDASM